MKMIIDIPEEILRTIRENNVGNFVYKAIKNGTPLPKGHGRLIDADKLRCENADFDTYSDYCTMFDEIDYAPTIIEADKEGETDG